MGAALLAVCLSSAPAHARTEEGLRPAAPGPDRARGVDLVPAEPLERLGVEPCAVPVGGGLPACPRPLPLPSPDGVRPSVPQVPGPCVRPVGELPACPELPSPLAPRVVPVH